MSFSALRSLYNSYRSCIFSVSYHTKLSTRTDAQLKTTLFRHYCSEKITVTFKLPDGTLVKRSGKAGETVRSTVKDDDPDFPGYGSCDGGISCGSCHVIFAEEDYEKVSEPEEREADELDKVHYLTPTSRLACGVRLVPEIDGIVLRIPKLAKK